jgi:hypothetical protein
MHLSGIKVPKLGSVQDRTFRAFMQKKVGQETSVTKLLAQIAVAEGNGDKSWVRSITTTFNDYLRSMYYLEAEHEDLEQDMLQQYNKFKHIRPKLVIEKDGKIVVRGVPKSVL